MTKSSLTERLEHVAPYVSADMRKKLLYEERYGFPYWRAFLWVVAVVLICSLATCWRVI